MNKPFCMLILLVSTLLGIGLARPVFADVPRVLNVVPHDVSASTYLNVTVYHSIEDPSSIPPHYVDQIRVTWGSNTTSLTITAQPLTPALNFTIPYDLGSLSGSSPAITVEAHCTWHGWSTQNWTGNVPEFSFLMILLALAITLSTAIFASRKIKSQNPR